MKNILVIDDNEQILKMMCGLLQRSGHTVFSAINGAQGLKTYYTHTPDLVITDIIMPEKEGLEVIMELTRQERRPKIIAISGGGRMGPQSYLPMADLLGADHVLQKPFHPAEFMDCVERLLA